MIVSCPSCTTRYDLGAHSSDEAISLSCRKCGHRWKELPVIDLVEVVPRNLPAVIDHSDEPELDIQRLVEAAQEAKHEFATHRKARIRNLTSWLSFAACVLLPLALAAGFPETVVAAAPVTIKAYDKLGFQINIYGLDIRRVEQQNQMVDGAHILLVKGEVSNATNDVRKIPWLRFALSDDSGKELYSWTLDTASRPLRPGETTSFTTRVAAPPELARNLQIRFAHRDEIGSSPAP